MGAVEFEGGMRGMVCVEALERAEDVRGVEVRRGGGGMVPLTTVRRLKGRSTPKCPCFNVVRLHISKWPDRPDRPIVIMIMGCGVRRPNLM